jgi:hypothetical protein
VVEEGYGRGIGESGPAWIGAIAALITALTAAGFFAGRATAPGGATIDTAPSVNNTLSTAQAPSNPQIPQGKTQIPQGTTLTHYIVDVSVDHGLSFGSEPARPTFSTVGPYDADLVVWVETKNLTTGKGQLVPLDTTEPGYQSCANDTRFVTDLTAGEGTAFCFVGHGIIAGVKLMNLSDHYDTFDVTVWKAT